MKTMTCDGCQETVERTPSPTAAQSESLEPWAVVGIDPMEFHCSIKGLKSKWLIAVDEATRLTVGKQLFEFPENTARNATGREIWEAFDGMW